MTDKQIIERLKTDLDFERTKRKTLQAELKAELEQEKALKETYLTCYKAKHEDIQSMLFKLKLTLIEIKRLLLTVITFIAILTKKTKENGLKKSYKKSANVR